MTNLEVAHALFNAVENRDLDAFERLLAPGAVAWQNIDPRERPATEVPARMREIWEKRTEWRYVERRYFEVPDGVVAQHVSRSVSTEGKASRVDAMLHLHMRDGRITRFEEYIAGQVRQPG